MRLEDFVSENRGAFDDREVPGELWEKLDKKLKGRTTGKIRVFKKMHFNFGIAAGILVLLSVGFLLGRYAKPDNHQDEIAFIDPGMANTLISYTNQIEQKRDELSYIKKDAPELYNEFLSDLIVLEENYKTLKAELPNNPNQEELIKAMVRNLQLQIELLTKQKAIGERYREKVKNTVM